MVNTQAFAAINIEQLVTATDRLLFGTVRRVAAPMSLARGSSTVFVGDEPTQCVRMAPAMTYRSSVVILGVAATLTWLAVVLICLLA